jgi:hypothetical protein
VLEVLQIVLHHFQHSFSIVLSKSDLASLSLRYPALRCILLEVMQIASDPFRPRGVARAYALLIVGGATVLTSAAEAAYDGPPDADANSVGLARWPCRYQELIVMTGRAWNVFFSVLAIGKRQGRM